MATRKKRYFKSVSQHRELWDMPSLAKKRTWFDDSGTQDDGQGQDPEKTAGEDKSTEGTKSEERTFSADFVAELRKENAKWRTDLRALAAQLDERKEADLEEKEEFKTLAEKRAEELKTLKADMHQKDIQSLKMATIQELGLPADAMEFLTGETEEAIKVQAEKFKSLIPEPSSEDKARSQTNPRRAATAIPGGDPSGETRQQKNRRLGLSHTGGNNIQ